MNKEELLVQKLTNLLKKYNLWKNLDSHTIKYKNIILSEKDPVIIYNGKVIRLSDKSKEEHLKLAVTKTLNIITLNEVESEVNLLLDRIENENRNS